MHVILATVGTDGDVFPYVGLGAALRARGHRVTLAAPETYHARAQALGIEFRALVTVAEVNRMLADPDLWHPFRSGIMMARWGGPMIQRHYEALAALSAQEESVLVANVGVLAARLVQEKLGIPTASLLLQPGLLPSSTAPPAMPGGLTMPTWLPHPLRQLYWLAVDAAAYALVAPSLNRVRTGLGLSPVRRVFRWWLSPDLVIGLFPGWYAAPQSDWPPQIRLAGFGRFDGVRAELPDDVRMFCEEGPPPIAFTLGTGMAHAAGFFRTAVASCDALGARGLLLTKFPDVIPTRLPTQMRHCPLAPFRQLLPLCAAVVHHGGIGTTAAALEAGCPQLVLPLAWDQPDNAARVAELGAGLALGSRRRSSGHMSRALVQLMAQDFRDRCRAIASRAGGENGLELAATWVEELAGMAKTVNRHVRLRDIEQDDLPRMYEFNLDPDANRQAMTIPRSADAFRAHWENVLADPNVVVKAISVNNVLAGYISCFKQDGFDAVGFWLGKESWGQGIASRALELFLKEVPIRPLHARVATSNRASLRVLHKCGFVVQCVQVSPADDRFLECEEAFLVLK